MKMPRKIQFLIVGIGVLAVLSYHLAIKKTIAVIGQHAALKEQLVGIGNSTSRQVQLAQKIKVYDSILTHLNLANTSIQNNLLRKLNLLGQTQNVIIADFNEPHISTEDDKQRDTYSFSLRGEFTEILKILYSLEKDGNFGAIVHVDFEKKKDFRHRSFYLEAKVFVQQIK